MQNTLRLCIYIDMNPKRAFMVKHPKEYKWSSFHHYAYGKKDPLLTDPTCYLELGETSKERQKKYIEMVDYVLLHDWKQKKNYSTTAFIGNPDWVKVRYFQLRQELKIRRNEKKDLKMAQALPP